MEQTNLVFTDPITQLKWENLLQLSEAIIPSSGTSTLDTNKEAKFLSVSTPLIKATAGDIGSFEVRSTYQTTYLRDVNDTRGIAAQPGLLGGAFDLAFWAGATFVNRLAAKVQIYASSPLIVLVGSSGTSRTIASRTDGGERWQIRIGNTTAENSPDDGVGSNFSITGWFSNTPSDFRTPFFIERKTGNILISQFGTVMPHASSALEIQSTTKGVRFPNMTEAQRDNITPGAGTVIYNTTTGKLNVYTTAWEAITSA